MNHWTKQEHIRALVFTYDIWGLGPAFVCYSVLAQEKGNAPRSLILGSMLCTRPFLALKPAITLVMSPFSSFVAILGMHTLMSNQQYYEALGSSTIVNTEGLNSK